MVSFTAHYPLPTANSGAVRSPQHTGSHAVEALSRSVYIVTASVEPEWETDFNRWYDEEHVPALKKVPGVLSARRFRTDEGAPQYVALYHLTGPEVASSDAWKKAVETPWTARIRPAFRNMLRLVLRKYEG